eukprot:CAMPEP_0179300518 /NCGR_PEP_ID=MMETSP0797-20121207/47074_1 /TAXON_ID=47934 /ORGANISM="Dinophysis acuminata, Strain DAEP01" /LENGTH=194 /DNA_ID=CAMNT_0021009987 /DNA_START=133 /DNA_END=713 /DNA_ORIENTATION=+
MPRQRLARLWARGAPGGAPMTPNLTPGTCGHAAATVGPVVESGGAGWRTDGRQLVIAPPLLRWARLHPQEACITILPTFTPQFSGRHPPARPGSMPSSSTRMCGASHLAAPPRSELACRGARVCQPGAFRPRPGVVAARVPWIKPCELPRHRVAPQWKAATRIPRAPCARHRLASVPLQHRQQPGHSTKPLARA